MTTAGPHRAIGFKFAEYVAMSRCIVAEPVATEIPGSFAEPRNYLTFGSPAACGQGTVQLTDDRVLRDAQMHSNWNYFRAWMEPQGLAHKVVDAVAERAPRRKQQGNPSRRRSRRPPRSSTEHRSPPVSPDSGSRSRATSRPSASSGSHAELHSDFPCPTIMEVQS